MKIGIISEYTTSTVNYGNCLQAYALNQYIQNLCADVEVQTIVIKHSYKEKILTSKIPISALWKKAFRRIGYFFYNEGNFPERESRKKQFLNFENEYINMSDTSLDYTDIENSDYDILIVGSDVVWIQGRYYINRIKFLDFNFHNPIKKVAYAASFGHDYIPEENKNHIRRCLKQFDNISVRESTTVEMLKMLGIEDVRATLDPTLLLSACEWAGMETEPKEVGGIKYAFVYLQSPNLSQHKMIEKICHEKNLQVVTIPFASGRKNKLDRAFGDICLWDASPQNWIWLMHHAEYVITDSFHGIVFSTIFHRKFVPIQRNDGHLMNRLTDYLKTIRYESEPMVSCDYGLPEYGNWDFGTFDYNLDKKRIESVDFLKEALGL